MHTLRHIRYSRHIQYVCVLHSYWVLLIEHVFPTDYPDDVTSRILYDFSKPLPNCTTTSQNTIYHSNGKSRFSRNVRTAIFIVNAVRTSNFMCVYFLFCKKECVSSFVTSTQRHSACPSLRGPGLHSWIATDWAVRGSNPGGTKFFGPVQTDPEAEPVSCKMGTEFLSRGEKRSGHNIYQPPH